MTGSVGRLFWLIEGRDGLVPIFRRAFPRRRYSEAAAERLLQMLAARSGLGLDEICEALGRRGSTTALLEVHRQFEPFALSCGDNPHFTARVLEEGDGRLTGLIEADPPPWRR